MLKQALIYLKPGRAGKFIDCTLGGAGYSLALARSVGETGRVVAIDLDQAAIANAKKEAEKQKLNNLILVNDNFRDLSKIIEESFSGEENFKFDGIVFDLGLSSAQLADRSRGFSFRFDAPLDMSFGRTGESGLTTTEIVNSWREKDLAGIIRQYGEEKFAARIAAKIAAARKRRKISTSGELVEIIKSSLPAGYLRRPGIHFATRTFQALRIATNRELENLEEALKQSLELLAAGGRLVVISYHSLEDRLVKRFFKQASRDCICPLGAPQCQCDHRAALKIISRKVIRPESGELEANPRSRSAKMRVAEKT